MKVIAMRSPFPQKRTSKARVPYSRRVALTGALCHQDVQADSESVRHARGL
jgi:hypothetical protein